MWNGKEALEYLLQPESTRSPDIILMDVQMPILDGYRATHLIRQHQPYASLPGIDRVPIVAMTASAIHGDREKCEKAGMDDYLAKPVKGRVLEQMLVKWVLRRQHYTQSDGKLHSTATDHDSECSDYNYNTRTLAPSSPDQGPPLSAASPVFNPTAASTYDPLSGAKDEGERELSRVVAKEKAEELRNDKLLLAADTENRLPFHRSVSAEHVVHSPGNTALTEENVDRFVRDQQNAEKAEKAREVVKRPGSKLRMLSNRN